MGCGMSRFDSRHHDHGLHKHSPSTTEYDVDQHSDITENNTRSGLRLLFFTNHGDGHCRRSVSSPLSPIDDLKHTPQMEPQVTGGNIVGRRKCCDGDGDHNHIDHLERKSDDDDDHDDDDQRLCNCNLEGNGGASPLFMGSPSFREYCFVDDNLKSNSDIINDTGNRDNKERELETMQREDDIKPSDEGCAESNGNSSSVKKRRGVRRMRKGISPNQRAGPAGAVIRRSLMNVASCYHPPPRHNLPSPPPNTNSCCKS